MFEATCQYHVSITGSIHDQNMIKYDMLRAR